MRYRILGTTQALRPDGTAVPVGGARLRALLTVLALRAGHTVPARLLVDEVWNGGDPPADATGALQALIGRLRRVLGAAAVASDDGGYRLAAAPDDIDLHRFERLTGEGLRALADGDAAKATVVLDDALALWRGPVLADLPDRAAEAARWEARCLDARRGRLAAALELGRGAQALPELTVLCDADPLDESLQALRLRALRAAGRTAQALAAYEDVRRLLADRLGSDPGPELRSLHAELLAAGDAPAVPVTVGADDGTGADDRSGTQGPAAPRGNLRARLTSFVGREKDIETIRGDLASARLVTLLGPGGAGKTRLSQETAETVDRAARDGVWLAELAPVDDPDTVPEAVIGALGARETVLHGAGAEGLRAAADRHDEPVERLVEHLGRRRVLLVLDNCEHVIGAAARLVEQLLERCPGLTVLATSREPLGVPGELLRPVEPLPDPVALRLLAERGAAARPGFRPDADPDTAAACAEICRRLDGLPLAIELAAARLRMLTPRQIADRLDDRFRLLTSGGRTLRPRQQTLRAVVDWSWDLLDGDERDVLSSLSVFAGGCDLAAAEAVCGPHVLEALGSLVDKSLVVAAPSGDDGMRYRLLETVAEYAAERLDESGRRAETERAHLTYYRQLAGATDPLLRGSGQLAAIEVFQREYENLRTALRRAVALRDEQEALFLVLALTWYWQIRDLRVEARTMASEVMALGPDPFTEPVRPAAEVWERPEDVAPPVSGELLLELRRGAHLIHLACMDVDLGAWNEPAAKAKLRVIAQVYEPGMPQTCRNPGSLSFFASMLAGDMDRLRSIIDASVETCRRAPGYEWELAAALQRRANMLANRAELGREAARDAQESLDIFQRLGDSWGVAEALSARAEAHERGGRYQSAAADYLDAVKYTEHLGAHTQTGHLRSRYAAVLLETDERDEGERILREVISEENGTQNEGVSAARLYLCAQLAVTGRIAEGREQLRLLRAEFGNHHIAVFDAFILGQEAMLDTLDECYEAGLDKARRALVLAFDPLCEAIAPQMRSMYLYVAANVLASADDGRRGADAARCIGAATAFLQTGHVPTAVERYVRDRAVERTRSVLDAAAYEAHHAEGTVLTTEEATALV